MDIILCYYRTHFPVNRPKRAGGGGLRVLRRSVLSPVHHLIAPVGFCWLAMFACQKTEQMDAFSGGLERWTAWLGICGTSDCAFAMVLCITLYGISWICSCFSIIHAPH